MAEIIILLIAWLALGVATGWAFGQWVRGQS